MVQKLTQEYANHGLSLKCDIYTQDDYPKENPVFLYFHPGGLVDGNRACIAPWLVQTCIQRKWPLISPSYRLLPQAGGQGLLQDATAVYEFALNWDTLPSSKRQVIVGGASGGVFMAALIAHHCQPKPLALLSIQGINTFRHPFFNSSIQTAGEEIPHAIMENFVPPVPPERTASSDGSFRGMLYDYYTFNNAFVGIVDSVDPGYQWAKLPEARDRVAQWPRTVIFHGNQDPDVELNVSEDMRDCLGEDKVTLIIADGQPHLYELEKFIEDDAPGMDAVREAVARLDEIVASP
ncbi:hypothetical protein TrVFT333_010967 [Trichoderma virens FT-333]|nr:hypothetical protein TrVFT333_010967 [Trichoderma virens FT-333]